MVLRSSVNAQQSAQSSESVPPELQGTMRQQLGQVNNPQYLQPLAVVHAQQHLLPMRFGFTVIPGRDLIMLTR